MTEPNRSVDWNEVRRRVRGVSARLENPSPGEEEIQKILAQRARRLAQRPAAQPGGPSLDVLVFRLGEQRYGLPLAALQGVLPGPALTPVPGAPGRWAGVFVVEGRIRPALDLCHLLRAESAPRPARRPVLRFEHGGRSAGLPVDAVEETRTIFLHQLRPPAGPARHLRGSDPNGILVLDEERFFEQEAASS